MAWSARGSSLHKPLQLGAIAAKYAGRRLNHDETVRASKSLGYATFNWVQNLDVLSVPDAASFLRVDPSRVRALLAAGLLDGEKVGGRWLVSGQSLRDRDKRSPGRGRRFSAANAWAVLALASQEDAPWVEDAERNRLAALLGQRGLSELVGRFDDRAEVERYFVHPSLLKRMRSDRSMVPAGAHAKRERGARLLAGDDFDAYASASDYDRIVRDFALDPSDRPNVILRVVPEGLWPFHDRRMPLAAVALDLAELPDARSRRIGRSLLAELG